MFSQMFILLQRKYHFDSQIVHLPSQSLAAENSPIPVAEVVPDNARVELQELLHDDELNTMQLNVNPEK